MAFTRAVADPNARNTVASRLRDYYALSKPEVNLLILMTTSAGYYLASEGPLRVGRLVITLLGTLLVASGTATLNQWMERYYDAQMRRTAHRPLVSGRLSGKEAFWFGLSLSVAGGALLAACVNTVSALLAVGTLLGYLLVYTPLKRKTPLCTLLGAVPAPCLRSSVGPQRREVSNEMHGCSLLFSFCGSFLTFWPSRCCTAKTTPEPVFECCHGSMPMAGSPRRRS